VDPGLADYRARLVRVDEADRDFAESMVVDDAATEGNN
jgi:hypothetical protein